MCEHKFETTEQRIRDYRDRMMSPEGGDTEWKQMLRENLRDELHWKKIVSRDHRIWCLEEQYLLSKPH